MKNKFSYLIVYILALIVTFVNLGFSVKGAIFSDINDLPKGEKIYSVTNSNGESTINIYLISNSIGNAVRGELVTGNKTKNVYWQTGIDTVNTVWVSGSVIDINGIRIDVLDGGFYDCRRGISLFQEGAIEGEEETKNE